MAEMLKQEIFVVDDDPAVIELFKSLLTSETHRVVGFADGDTFINALDLGTPACLIMDVFMPGRSGLEILKGIDTARFGAPILIMSGHATIPMAVEAMNCGAFDIVEKPFDPESIAARILELIVRWNSEQPLSGVAQIERIPGAERLTQREREVLAEIAGAASNKEAARNLGLSPRTIEVHRAHIMMKLGAKNTADLVRIVLGRPAYA